MKKSLFIFALVLVFLVSFGPIAQEPYKLPPMDVVDIADTPPTPFAFMSPTSENMLLAEYDPMPSIAYMAQPMLRLAGMRITPNTNSRMQTNFCTGLVIKKLKDGETIRISLPEGAKLGFPEWSYDDQWIAFNRYTASGVELWVAETETGKAKALTPPHINAILNDGFRWMPDNRHLLINIILEDRGEPPPIPAVPVGPNIQQTSGKFAKVWTYQDLLQKLERLLGIRLSVEIH